MPAVKDNIFDLVRL